jgi:hypothetical protein
LHRELEFFLTAFSDSEDDNEGTDKIITFKINPIIKKDILKDIIIQNFQNYVTKKLSISFETGSN